MTPATSRPARNRRRLFTGDSRGTIRSPILVGLSLLSLVVLLKLLFFPSWGASQPQPLDLPLAPRIEGWDLTTREVPDGLQTERPRAVSAASYSYARDGVVVRLEARYFDRSTGDAGEYAAQLKAATDSGELRSTPKAGWHRVRTSGEFVILETCLDAKGRATATADQFAANRRLHDRPADRLVLWLFGRGPLHDSRCLWLHLFTAMNDDRTEDETVAVLETVFAGWRGAWLQSPE